MYIGVFPMDPFAVTTTYGEHKKPVVTGRFVTEKQVEEQKHEVDVINMRRAGTVDIASM